MGKGMVIGELIRDGDGRPADFYILDVNSVCEKLTGFGRSQLAGRRATEIASFWKPEFFRRLDSVVGAGETTRFEERNAGLGRWYEAYACSLHDGDRFAIVFDDITERKRTEEALHQSERFLNNVFDCILDGISVLDRDLNIVRTNRVMEKWYPHASPLEHRKCYEAYHSRSSPCELCPSRKAIELKAVCCERRPFQGEGGVVKGWMSVCSYPLMDEGGNVIGVIEHVRDITSSVHDKEALRESEEMFRAVAETSSVAMCILQDGKFLYVNPAMEMISGYTKEELHSADFMCLVHPDVEERIKGQYIKWISGASAEARAELKGITRKGDVCWADICRKTISYQGRSAILITGVDITERKLAEEALRHSEERYRQLTESSADFIYIIDRDYRVQFVNNAGATVLRISPESAIGMSLERLFPPDTFDHMKKSIMQVFETGKPRTSEIVHKFYGGDYYVHVVLTPLFDGDGKANHVMGVSRDINDVKMAEAALRESEEKFRVLAETSPAAICVFRGDEFVYVNPAAERISGYSKEEFLRMSLSEALIPGCRDRMKEWTEARKQGTPAPSRYEICFVSKSGEARWIDVSLGPINLGGAPAFIVSAFDITERKQVEKELRDAKAQAELYLDLLGHDINNMHQMALGYLEIARDTWADDSQKVFLDKPIEALQRSARLIRNVRKLQRIREGTFGAQTIDLCMLLSDLGVEYGALPDKAVSVNLNGHTHCYVRANELLYDVFSNLVSNAVKHTPEHASISISLDGGKEGDTSYYTVSVEDDGQGIPDEFKGMMFTRSFKGTFRKSGNGMGIGLYLVKTLVDSYNGRVWVEDRVPGSYTKGAKFVVRLPDAPG